MKNKYDIIHEKLCILRNYIQDVKNFSKDTVSLEKENKVLMHLNKAIEVLKND